MLNPETSASDSTPGPAPQELPAEVEIGTLQSETKAQLLARLQSLGLRAHSGRTRAQLVFDASRAYAERRVPLFTEGMLDLTPEKFGFLRSPRLHFRPGADDIYVSSAQVKRFGLRSGNLIRGRVRGPRDKEKFMALEEVQTIEGIPVSQWQEPPHFDQLTPLFPNERIILENPVTNSVSARAVDLITPLGRGQRALIVAPPRVGKTILLKEIAQAIRASSPEDHVIMLLVDERPEEVTDLQRSVDAEIYCSTFDENPARHIQVAELISERSKRLVELGKNVIVLLDSITRLARSYNAMQPAKGRIMSGGVEAKALLKPKKFFGAARNVEDGGSLTIIATALIETGSRMDEVIFEEFKGTGNMELHLDRSLVETRLYPGIHILNSGTRREELLYHPAEFERVSLLRKQLASLPPIEAMEVLLGNIKATSSNTELLLAGLRHGR
jgi:transcription termination factor Rho